MPIIGTVLIIALLSLVAIITTASTYVQAQERLFEDYTSDYFEQRGYNITTYDFFANGTLLIIAEPLGNRTSD